MKIYLDLILIINFFYDFILLIAVGLINKRIINIKKITIGSFIGSLSILLLFYDINNLLIFIYKLILSFIMIIISYPKKDIKYFINNLITFYIVSFFLGGTLYALNINMSYEHLGLVFINKKYDVNYIILFIMSPIIVYLYIKHTKYFKNKYNNYYDIEIYINNEVIKAKGYLDSGNNLTFKKKPVILIDKRKVIFLKENYRIIPYKVVNNIQMLKIYKSEYIKINNKIIKDIYIGLTDSLGIDGVDVLLNNKLLEDI